MKKKNFHALKKGPFQVLTKAQQANIRGGGQMCIGSFEGSSVTIVEDDGYYFAKIQGLEPEFELTAGEAEDICTSFAEHQN